MYQVKKRDGKLVEFDMSKITTALSKAFNAKGVNYTADILNMLALRVTADFAKKIKDNVMSELKREFRPELINRIDEIIVFHPLTKDNIEKIVTIMMKGLVKRLAADEITLVMSDEANACLAEAGFDVRKQAAMLEKFYLGEEDAIG